MAKPSKVLSRRAISQKASNNNIKYFRRCHVCNSLCVTTEDHVQRCEHCDKPFAKFQYYDDKYVPICSDSEQQPIFREEEYIPIRGLTVYWEPF